MPQRSVERNPHALKSMRERLRLAMNQRGWLSTDLASAARVPLTSVTRLLNGSVKSPGIDTVISLAGALELSVSELLGDSPALSVDMMEVSMPKLIEHQAGEAPYITLLLTGPDRPGLLSAVTGLFAAAEINIHSCFSGRSYGGKARIVINVDVDDESRLHRVVNSLRLLGSCEVAKMLYPRQAGDWMGELAAFLNEERQPTPLALVAEDEGGS